MNKVTGKAKQDAGRKGGQQKKTMTPEALEQRRAASRKDRRRIENPSAATLAKRMQRERAKKRG